MLKLQEIIYMEMAEHFRLDMLKMLAVNADVKTDQNVECIAVPLQWIFCS